MGNRISLTASDGFELGGYRADPAGKPKGGLVVLQEICGVNAHMREVCDRFAAQGYVAVAPAIFDRQQRDFECGYSEAELAAGLKIAMGIDWRSAMLDIGAAAAVAREAGRVGAVGYCFGGFAVYYAAARTTELDAAVAYYFQIGKALDWKPNCPVQVHFGASDAHIPLAKVEAFREKRPDVEVNIYEGAGHGFNNNDEHRHYNAAAAELAQERTLAWLERYIAA